MKTVVYRKSDLTCVGTVANGMTVEQEIELNVIPNFGGVVGDYDSIETDETNFHLESIDEIITVVKNVQIPIIHTPSETELLEQRLKATEDALLQLMMEGMI